ncbi:MAG: alginate O-acetyltransferase complex protein AlgI, partial [Maribacter sp.]
MLFNSLEYLIFLPIILILYWLIGNGRIFLQNLFILFASYVFYGWWDWRFLFLIFFSSNIDFFIGKLLDKETGDSGGEINKKLLLAFSVTVNIGLLLYFKYFNFFIESFTDLLDQIGVAYSINTISIILPVGISFYTFQTLSYSIDIYNNKIKATKDYIAFLAYVSFFPQLVAGPIERAKNLLPQFLNKRSFHFENAKIGTSQILWGFLKKVVIADNCAPYVNDIFANYSTYPSQVLLFGAILFSFQIYCDFSGYSDIAIGTARLFGIKLMTNFKFPYFSRDIAEFWRRWHISLSTWFRDYLYIPLGGSKGSLFLKIRNVFIIFIVSGFWHGANWTFMFWGFINAMFFLPLLLRNKNRKNMVYTSRLLPGIIEIYKMFLTFCIITFAWIFFRSATLNDAFAYISRILEFEYVTSPLINYFLILIVTLFVIVEWI